MGQFMTAKYSESLHSETSSAWYVSCISILFLTGHPLICSLFSFMLKGFGFPIQKLIEWEVLLSQHVWFPDSHKEDGGSWPDAHSDTTALVSPCFQYSSLLGVNTHTPCMSISFIAFPILQSDFLCDRGVLQNIFSLGPACHISVTCLMIMLEKKRCLEIQSAQNLPLVAFLCGKEFFRLLLIF